MFTSDSIAYLWQMWVGLFSGLGLPWGSQASGFIGLVFAFYLVGLAFKVLVAPPK